MHPDRASALVLLAAIAACSRTPTPEVIAPDPGDVAAVAAAPRDSTGALLSGDHVPMPEARGPLDIKIVYPRPDALVDAADSSFIFGSLGAGDAKLTINGQSVHVWPNGAWLGWIALPPDSAMRLDLLAWTPRDTARLLYELHRVPRFTPPPGRVAWIDTTSFSPSGRVWWPRDEYLPLEVRAAPGAEVRLRLADGSLVPLVPDPAPAPVPWGIRAFDHDTAHLRRPVRHDRYRGVIRGRAIGPDPGPVVDGRNGGTRDRRNVVEAERTATEQVSAGPSFPRSAAVLEVIVGADTARAEWPLQLAVLDTIPVVVALDDDTAGTGTTDSLTIGRSAPGATYNWFFPTGTHSLVSARMNQALRLRVSESSQLWIPADDAQPLPRGRPAPRATVGSLTLTPLADRVVVRIPLTEQVPFQIRERERGLTVRIYGAEGDVNWIRYGNADSLVRQIVWAQPTADEVSLDIELTKPLWGYRTQWDKGDLILEIRRPPAIDPDDPFEGRVIVVDPGHPPLGATGPTGLREPDANLAVALQLHDLLEEAGAQVVMVRTRDSAVDLLPRVQLAERIDADLLISIHNNALPDGVNPLTNSGSSVFYNHLPSLPLARAVQAEVVERLGTRDLGVGRGDLALVRPTWMPAVLTEGLFMMLPEHEALLRSPEGQRRYAEGVFAGIERFLQERGSRERRDTAAGVNADAVGTSPSGGGAPEHRSGS